MSRSLGNVTSTINPTAETTRINFENQVDLTSADKFTDGSSKEFTVNEGGVGYIVIEGVDPDTDEKSFDTEINIQLEVQQSTQIQIILLPGKGFLTQKPARY